MNAPPKIIKTTIEMVLKSPSPNTSSPAKYAKWYNPWMRMKSDNKTVRILRLLLNLKLRYTGTMAAANMITPLAKWIRFSSNKLINFYGSH
jgi:hypothetical protein